MTCKMFVTLDCKSLHFMKNVENQLLAEFFDSFCKQKYEYNIYISAYIGFESKYVPEK